MVLFLQGCTTGFVPLTHVFGYFTLRTTVLGWKRRTPSDPSPPGCAVGDSEPQVHAAAFSLLSVPAAQACRSPRWIVEMVTRGTFSLSPTSHVPNESRVFTFGISLGVVLELEIPLPVKYQVLEKHRKSFCKRTLNFSGWDLVQTETFWVDQSSPPVMGQSSIPQPHLVLENETQGKRLLCLNQEMLLIAHSCYTVHPKFWFSLV